MRIITKHVLDGGNQLLMYIAGVGGTGKSHLIKTIVQIFSRLGIRDALHIGAPTGISATLIGGYTLHSLTMTTPIGKSKDMDSLAALWRGVRYLIVDEISMVGALMLSDLSSRMKQAMGDDEISRMLPFGGINVIFCGDFGQLKPPRQHSLFAYELVKNPSFEQARNREGVSALNGAFLWRQVNLVVQLVKNQRHEKDPEYAEFLDRMRKGECIQRYHHPMPFGPESDLDYLRSRELSAIARTDPQSLSLFNDAPVIVGSKFVRDAVNTMLIGYHARRLSVKVSVYHSADSFSRKPLPDALQDVVWKLPASQTKDFLGQLPIFCGMRVMVLENVAFSVGVVNGAEGTVTDVKYTLNSRGHRVASVVFVHIPGSGLRIDGLLPDVVPLFPQSVRIKYKVKGSDGDVVTRTFTRKQIPIIPAYSYTDFKSQGRTLEYVIVDLATARTQGVYVMLSRVKSLHGLAILRWFPATKIYQRVSQEMRSELERINSLDDLTRQRFDSGEFVLRPISQPLGPSVFEMDVDYVSLSVDTDTVLFRPSEDVDGDTSLV
jgi:ATP-dependent DNA helicase PIF1